MNTANSIGPNLSRVVMPLVKLMKTGELSWADREVVADAIRDALRAHESINAEQQLIRGAALGGVGAQMQAAGYGQQVQQKDILR